VIVRCRVAQTAREELPARAELTFEVAATSRRSTTRASAELRLGSVDRRLETDLEVQKNHAIAVLAQACATWPKPARPSAGPTRTARCGSRATKRSGLFPDNDPDVQRVRDMAANYARTLQRYVDRFRDY
jgi:hypothetical protein